MPQLTYHVSPCKQHDQQFATHFPPAYSMPILTDQIHGESYSDTKLVHSVRNRIPVAEK